MTLEMLIALVAFTENRIDYYQSLIDPLVHAGSFNNSTCQSYVAEKQFYMERRDACVQRVKDYLIF